MPSQINRKIGIAIDVVRGPSWPNVESSVVAEYLPDQFKYQYHVARATPSRFAIAAEQ
jgi:hypothetical protein